MRYTSPFTIWTGYSFLCQKDCDPSNIIYIYSCRENSIETAYIENRPDMTEFISRFRGLSDSKLLEKTFVSTRENNPFQASGFVPIKLICNTVWIRK